MLFVRQWLMRCRAVFAVLVMALVVCSVSHSGECERCQVNGLNCGDFCSDAGFTYTMREQYLWVDPMTGQMTVIIFYTPYRIFKRCTDTTFGEAIFPWPEDPVNGQNITASNAPTHNCNAATALYRYLGNGGGGTVTNCSGGISVSPMDPYLLAMTAAQRQCNIFVSDCNGGVVGATKNCRTGLPLNPIMPLMP